MTVYFSPLVESFHIQQMTDGSRPNMKTSAILGFGGAFFPEEGSIGG